MTEINIVGKGYNDILLYLSAIIRCLDKKLLIRDMTRRHEFYSCIPQIQGLDPAEKVTDYRGTGYTFGERNGRNPQYDEPYEVCFRLFDLDMSPSDGNPILFICDEQKSTVDSLEMLKFHQNQGILVIKNYTGTIKKQFDRLIEIMDIRKIYTVPLNSADIKYGILAEYRDEVSFSGISAPFKDMLCGIILDIFPDIKNRDIQKAMKNAMKGMVN